MLRVLRRLSSVLALSSAVVACSSSSSDGGATPPAAIDEGAATCNPLRTAGACLLPYPSAVYETPDPSTKTGFRVALAKETLPTINVTNKPLDPAPYNAADGFSPATPILAYFPEQIDPASLPSIHDMDKSTAAGSATVLYDMDAKKLLPHFSEVDQTATRETDRQGLMIRPAARLAPGHRYAVAITSAIKTVGGGAPTPPPQFAAIADGNPPGDAMSQKQAARMPEILAALDAAGVHRGDLVLAWDFVTGSDEYLTSHVLSMRDQALAVVGDSGIAYKITSVEDDFDAATLRRVRGTFTVPQFLDQTDSTKPKATLSLDEAGKPKMLGQYEAPFTVIIPRAAATATAPLPLVLFGHGLLGSGEGELGDAKGSYLQDLANEKGYVLFATDWIGLSQAENPIGGTNGAAGEALTDFNNLPWVTDRLQQAIVNAIALGRTMRGKIANDPALTVTGAAGGQPVADTSKLYYYGISLGGIMGGSFMGYDPDVTKGVLNVAGGEWSLLFQRSSNWREFVLLIGSSYPDKLDQQALMGLAQFQFDFSDPITVASHSVLDPLPGTPQKQILQQMAIGDAQVPNFSSELVARTMGLPLLDDSAIEVWGLPPTPGPLPSAFSIWDPKATPLPPDTNATPTMDNGAHGAIRAFPKLMDQIDHFFSTGEVIDTCGGPCGPD